MLNFCVLTLLCVLQNGSRCIDRIQKLNPVEDKGVVKTTITIHVQLHLFCDVPGQVLNVQPSCGVTSAVVPERRMTGQL